MCLEPFEFAGQTVPAGVHVAYSSWASHRLPQVFEDPEAFMPERFKGPNRARLPKGAYVPFGGGSRTCIGMRFAQLEIKTIATLLLQQFRPQLRAGYRLSIRQMPTLSPAEDCPSRSARTSGRRSPARWTSTTSSVGAVVSLKLR